MTRIGIIVVFAVAGEQCDSAGVEAGDSWGGAGALRGLCTDGGVGDGTKAEDRLEGGRPRKPDEGALGNPLVVFNPLPVCLR